MTSEKSTYLLLTFLAITSAVSVSYVSQSKGRKLFGGYRIVPKVCQPTNPSRIKSNQPSICMFNYECSRRRGEVVGACTDGFLFGACCQLPSKQNEILDKSPNINNQLNLHEIDHVPDIPILLNPDGTPVGITIYGDTSTTKIESPDHDNSVAGANIKISTFRPLPSTSGQMPPSHYNDNEGNAEKPQIPAQADFSHLDVDFPALLNQQGILNDLKLPGLLIHSNLNDIQDHQDPSEINPVTTLLSPDQVLQIVDPVDQLPALFSQGLSQNNHASADTFLLNENGTMLNETSNPDDLFKPNVEDLNFPTDEKIVKNAQNVSPQPAHESTVMQQMELSNQKISPSNQKLSYSTLNKNTTTWLPVNTQSTSTERITTSTQGLYSMSDRTHADLERVSTAGSVDITMTTVSSPLKTEMTTSVSSTNSAMDDLIRVPAIIYDSQLGNKKNDMLDHEEMSINHIISILNDTTSNLESQISPESNSRPPIHTWISVDETSKSPIVKLPPTKPSTSIVSFPYTFHKPGQMPPFYDYGTTEAIESSSDSHVVPSNFYSSRPTSTQGTYDSSSFSHSTRPSTNPPAPTVIVLGPLGTEYTKYIEMTQQSPTKRPVNAVEPNITNVSNMSTIITHNINTIISTNNVKTNSSHVVSTSYISVNLKDITSTKPVTNKDGTTTLAVVLDNDLVYEQTTTTNNDHVAPTSAVMSCDDETPAPDDLINFPPVRNPNLNISIPASQQEKPTIIETFNNTGYPDIELLSENEIPTPAFIEDDMLTNKVNVFVNKIVESLQGNFEDLENVVYNKKNISSMPSTSTTVTRPTPTVATTRKPVRRPIQFSKPSQATTKRPPTRLSSTTQRPVSGDRPIRPASPTILRPEATTNKPQTTTRRAKPPRKPTIPITSTEAIVDDTEEILSSSTTISPTSHKPISDQDFRKECGIRPLMKSGRIVGGKGAKFGQWPWQVLVREATWLGLFTKNKCGGVLITNKYVVTAAHCQPGFLASLVAVFGEFDISGELETKRSVTRNIRRVIVNRGYDPATFENDLALLELETPIQFDSHIVPICMPEDGADFTGRIATVTGWGRLKYNGGVPSVLQEVQVPIIENSVCQEMFQTAGHSKLILDSFLCAGYANGQKDSCEGDSGGPLTMEGPDGRWILVGTVSHGIKCAAPYLPGVYMRTTYFKPWLHSITGI